MALSIGTKTAQTPSLNASSYTYTAHSQNVGADGFLYMEVVISSTWTLTDVTWGGTSMTLLDTNLVTGVNIRVYRYYMDAPATGLNDIVVSFSSNYTTSFNLYVQSFTGCDGISDSSYSGPQASPHNDTSMTVATGDALFGSGCSLYPIATIDIDGTDYFSPNFSIYGSVQGKVHNGQIRGNLTAPSSKVEMITGAPSFQVSNQWVLFGGAAATPTIITSTGTLSGFTYAEGSGPSAEQTFTVSGNDLTANVTITAPTNYEVSLSSGTGFASSVVATQSGGDIVGEPKTIYVRLKAGLSEGTYNSEDISLTSTGATTETVTLNGSVSAAPATRRRIWVC